MPSRQYGELDSLPTAYAADLLWVWAELLVRWDGRDHWRDAQQVLAKEGRQAGDDLDTGRVQPKLLLEV